MTQKFLVTNEWIKDAPQFNEDFIKYFNEESDEGYFLEVGVQYIVAWKNENWKPKGL